MAKKILIVDDEELIRESLSEMLEDDIDIIHTAYDGLNALDVYEKHKPFDVILTDINMPRMDGIEFIMALREKNEDVLVVFFTAFGIKDLMFKAAKCGAFEFICKPDFENVIEVINSAVNYKKEEISPEQVLSEFGKMLNEIKK
jgi:CheY-like chemotaxis protein